MDARALVAEVARKSDLKFTNDTLLADVDGWDSLKSVRLVLRLQEITGHELTEDDIGNLQSIADVDRLLQACA